MSDTTEVVETNHDENMDVSASKPPMSREVQLGGDRTALEMLNDLIFDDPIIKEDDSSELDDDRSANPIISTVTKNTGPNTNTNTGENAEEACENNEPYEVNDVDVAKLKRQVVIDDNHARALLTKHKGDQVAAMLDAYDVEYKPENPTGITMQRGMKKGEVTDLNNDLYDKDEYDNDYEGEGTEKTELKPIVVDMESLLESQSDSPLNNYQCAMLSFSTDSFRPYKKRCTITQLVNSVAVPAMLESPLNNTDNLLDKCELTPIEFNRVLGLDNAPNNKLKCLHLTGMSRKVFKKWGMYECGMLFYESQVIDNQYIIDNKCFTLLNKHATRLGRLIGFIGDKKSIIGNCAVINNAWL